MEASSTIVTKALMLFAVLAAVPLWVMSGLTVDDLVRPFRGDNSAAPAPQTTVDLGEATTEFPFDRLGGETPSPPSAEHEEPGGSPTIQIDIPGGASEDETVGGPGQHNESPPDAGGEPPFWNNEPPVEPPPAFARPDAVETDPPGDRGPEPPIVRSAPPASASIEPMLKRLDDLNAVNMSLTRMSRGQAYRFRCEFPIPANASARRFFEVTDTSEARAVARVLAEVERWRGSGQQH